MGKIRVAIAGVGNCASSLVQGIYHYNQRKPKDAIGLMHYDLGGYKPGDIQFVAAFDIDQRKVGRDLSTAIFAPPNCTKVFNNRIPKLKVPVMMGELLDGFSQHLKDYPPPERFVPAKAKAVDVVKALKNSGADILINYLPVGSEEAVRFYAEAALAAKCAFINCIPVFIASDKSWAGRFQKAGLPIVGDDIKSQIGATIIHRNLMRLFAERGVKIDRTYQLNTGGNTDFLNMLNRQRLTSKKLSKTRAVQSQLSHPLEPQNIHIGPSDYIPWQKDNKVCFLRIEGRIFGNIPINLELRLSVEDSPNSAGVGIDIIRCTKLALDRKVSGPLTSIAAYTMKHPPTQMPDNDACHAVEDFIAGRIER